MKQDTIPLSVARSNVPSPQKFFVQGAAFILTCFSFGLYAQEPEVWAFSGALEVGAENNSNLSVEEIDQASNQSDTAGTLDAELALSWQPNARVSGELGYSYSTERYQELDFYDLDMHLLYGDLSYDFEDMFTLGGSYYYADADLGGDSFLTLDQYSLYLGKFINDDWYLRPALNFTDKAFSTLSNRDAETRGISVDSFWFFNQGRSSFIVGYRLDNEDSLAPEFDYQGNTLRLRFGQDFTWLSKDTRFEAGLRWQDRDYDNPYPGLGIPRADKRQILDVALEMNLLDELTLIGGLEHGNYESNLASADYSDERISLAVRFSF